MKLKGLVLLLALLLIAIIVQACAGTRTAELAAVEKVDLDRFAGAWHVIANIPYRAERGAVQSRVEYRPRPDGRFDDIYIYREHSFDAPEERMEGIATIRDPGRNARWTSRFYWLLSFDFSVLHLEPDYSTMLLGHRSRDYAWIMSRSPAMDDATYRRMLGVFADLGFDPTRLQRVPQFREQIGQPGFQDVAP
jgi:apolipoprotein D and lipocalin family protein